MSEKQNKAQRLADELVNGMSDEHWNQSNADAAALLLRQDELLRQALEALSKGTSWMEHGELIAAIRTHREAK